MKNIFYLAAIVLLASCGGGGSGTIEEPVNKPQPPTEVPVQRIAFAKSTYEVNVGSTVTMKVDFFPSNASSQSVVWESSDPHLAKFAYRALGDVTALAPGTVTITANCAGLKATCSLVIKDVAEDLSLYDIHFAKQAAMNTANSYVVSKPGVYKIPLVYGNAIKNGSANRDAYIGPEDGDNDYLKYFIDHDGKEIFTGDDEKDPWVSCRYPVNKAIVLWQDSDNLISNLSYGGAENALEKKYLYFTVTEKDFNQGNAVLAVYSGSQIVWSWHIWVTNVNLTPVTIKNYEGKTFSVMPVYLGWCEPQSATSKNGGPYGNVTYYQWGRKDPMLPISGEALSTGHYPDKKYYRTSGSPGFNSVQYNYGKGEKYFVQLGITNPGTFITNYRAVYINLWNMLDNVQGYNGIAKPSDGSIIKTIYDPSPAGYFVAPYDFLTIISPTGDNILVLDYDISEWNIMGGYNKGVQLYTLGWKTGPVYFLRAMGVRDMYGGGGLGGSIQIWSAHASSRTAGRCVDINSYGCLPLSGAVHDGGLSVLPVKEF